jgi:Tfp pilus assembly protein FimT
MNKNKKAVSIIELLAIMAIIAILFIWATSYDYNTASDKQRLEIFSNSIISQIETVMINAMTWKAVNSNTESSLVVPEERKIEFSKWTGTTISTSYKINEAEGRTLDEEIVLDSLTNIVSIDCSKSWWEDSWQITFKWTKIKITQTDVSSCTNDYTSITIKFQYKNNFSETIKFNVVNGLVEKVKDSD